MSPFAGIRSFPFIPLDGRAASVFLLAGIKRLSAISR
jgi:hypothetical protein